jgi:gliding motility-associated-like protein
MKKLQLLFIFLFFFSTYVFAQDYNMQNGTITTCSGNFYDTGGASANYINNENITITFCPETAGMGISLNFSVLDVESGWDFISFYDGNSTAAPLIATMTGNTVLPVIAASMGNTTGCITVKFTSDSSISRVGWAAAISCIVPQPNNDLLMQNGNITTCGATLYDAGGPYGLYANNENKTLTLCPETAGMGIFLDFSMMNISSGDNLYIYDGNSVSAPLLATLSGTGVLPEIGTSTANTTGCMTLRFTSNSSTVSAGWAADISCYEPTVQNNFFMQNGSATTCEGTFYDDGGAWGNYSNSANLTYTINPATAGQSVQLAFTTLDLESSYDRLYVYDGPTTAAPLITILSGTYTTMPTLVASAANTSGSLTLRFTSDSIVNRIGWAADISCVTPPVAPTDVYTMQNGTFNTCGGTFYDSGNIMGYYNDNENSTITFCSGTPGQSIFLDFTSFNLSSGDTLEFYDGASTSAPLIVSLTGTTVPDIGASFANTSGCLTLRFISNTSTINSGWAANISCYVPEYEEIILMQNGTFSTCDATFFDTGGEWGAYQNSENRVITFCPTTPDQRVRLNFSAFNVESGWDFLTIYDGADTSGAVIGTYTGTQSPGMVTASDDSTTGCLTVKFTSDSIINAAGWEAAVSCIIPCQDITAAFTVSPTPEPTSAFLKICQGTEVTFTANATFSVSGEGATYQWNFGDGTTGTGMTATHVYTTAGGYNAILTVIDNNATQVCSTLSEVQVIHVYSTPDFTGTAAAETEICLEDQTVLTGMVVAVPVEVDCTPPVSEITFLPDGNGVSYETSITVNCFSSNQTITNVNQILGICLNMEHSYLGDLDIQITSPNGQTVILKDYDQGGGSSNLGIPWATATIDGNSTVVNPGVGSLYCFLPDDTLPTLVEGSVTGGVFPSGDGPGTYTDSYIPAGNYSSFESFTGLLGSPLNGDWTIQVTDNLGLDNGYIFSWEINFDPSLTTSNLNFTPVIVSQSWTPNASIISTVGNQITVLPTTAGEKCYTYNATDDIGCTYSYDVCITVNPLPNNNNIEDLHECNNGNNQAVFDLESVVLANDNYYTRFYTVQADAEAGNSNTISNMAYLSSTAVIYVRFEDPTTACYDVFPLNLVVDALPVVAGQIGNLTACNEGANNGVFDIQTQQGLILGAQTGMTVSYYNSLVDAQQESNAIVVSNLSEFNSTPRTLYVRIENNSTGCYINTSFALIVENCTPAIPNGFSPNGDGKNDLFTIEFLRGVYPDFKFTIFNRWGNVVAEKNSGNTSFVSGNSGAAIIWDGTVDGVISSDPEASTYFFTLELNDGVHGPINNWIYVNP